MTWGCNYACGYCRPGGDGAAENSTARQISPKEVVKIAKLFEKIGCSQINLTGGEPTLRKDIGCIIDSLLLETDQKIHVNTNGFKFPEISDVVRARDRLEFITSLDSVDPATCTKGGRPGALQFVDKFLERARHQRIKSRINSVITKENDFPENINGLINFAVRRNLPIKFQTVFETSNQSFVPASTLYTTAALTRRILIRRGFKMVAIHNANNGVTEEKWMDAFSNISYILDKNPESTLFTAACPSCRQYPCDTGMYAFYVNHCGVLQLCRTDRSPICDLSKLEFNQISIDFLELIFREIYGQKITKIGSDRGNRWFREEQLRSPSPDSVGARKYPSIPVVAI